ncbi:Pyruvate kinase II [Raoultella terrigena]|uniref:Pyruvate kinase II n=1 Tax=Raoultella terrigena TaxID=577 RepID=A0A3P8KW18_RAOTE|nr:Pyruvate kinase II [Raoultella terrigena]VTN09961.1 Pyruvate kinase II [Raoultella terrigena]
MSRRLRRTKIVTTLGPATDRDNNLERLSLQALTSYV